MAAKAETRWGKWLCECGQWNDASKSHCSNCNKEK